MNTLASKRSKILLLLLVSTLVAIGSLAFILLHHEDGDNRVALSLQDTNGNSITEKNLKGQWTVLIFGFTHCPDICPSQAFNIAQSLKILDQRRTEPEVQAAFISVDYLRDTAAGLQTYLSHFHPRYHGYLGNKSQLDLTTDAFNTNYTVKQNLDSTTPVEVTHSSTIFVIDPTARIVKQLPFDTSADELANLLSNLIQSRVATS